MNVSHHSLFGEQGNVPPADEQIRAYLDANPDAFAQFLHREERRDPTWFRTYLRKQARIMGRGWL